MPGKSCDVWNVRPRPRPAIRFGFQPVTTMPWSVTSPRSGRLTPQTTFSSVVFPAPFGPMTPTIWPASTARETSLNA